MKYLCCLLLYCHFMHAHTQTPCLQLLSDLTAEKNKKGNDFLITWEISPKVKAGKFKIYRTISQSKSNRILFKEVAVNSTIQQYDCVDNSAAVHPLSEREVEYSIELMDNQGNTVCKTGQTPRAGGSSDYSLATPKAMQDMPQKWKYRLEVHGKTPKTVWIQPVLLDANHIPNDEDTYYVRFGEQLYEIIATPEADGLQKIKIPHQNNVGKVRQYQIVLIQGDWMVGISEEISLN